MDCNRERVPARGRSQFLQLSLALLTVICGCVKPAGCEPSGAAVAIDTEAAGQAFATLDGGDLDQDGVNDTLEDALGERFAPLVFHGERETAFPVSVDTWLRSSSLVFSANGALQQVVAGPLRQAQLLDHRARLDGAAVSSSGTRSRGKNLSFTLGDVDAAAMPASLDPVDWVTYVHSYPNRHGGITLQYWRAYTHNDARLLGVDVGHGGDWEMVAVHLDAQEQPIRTTYLDHSGIVDVTGRVTFEDRHPRVWSEEGGHSSYPDARHSRSTRWFRQDTRTGGMVTRWDGTNLGRAGGLRNVGEKSHPRNGQVFIRYSGLWGAPHRLFMTSGYWGPAFNETGATCASGASAYQPYVLRPADRAGCGPIRLNAWCDDADGRRLDLRVECFAATESR